MTACHQNHHKPFYELKNTNKKKAQEGLLWVFVISQRLSMLLLVGITEWAAGHSGYESPGDMGVMVTRSPMLFIGSP